MKPLFEHRHFAWLAAFCARHEGVAEELAKALAATNQKFDKDRFLAAARGCPAGRDHNVVPLEPV